jgi:D-beta-D-heptose 7-phosphate kinase/D-beta-D-heptose 1-phosphate adenosyltransferase
MVKLTGSFRSIGPFTALVLGDFMFDTYTSGRVKRISPEAPVPVLEVESIASRPGGAGNVVLNVAALGGTVFACGRVGKDIAGESLCQRLVESQVDVQGLFRQEKYQTPVKNRLIANAQQLLRVDWEEMAPLAQSDEDEVIAFVQKAITEVDVIAISDYGKGFVTDRIAQRTIEISRAQQVPVVVDPKGINFAKYRGATVVKPNLSEAIAAAKLGAGAPLGEVARELLRVTQAEHLLVTRSESGISLFNRAGAHIDFPVRSREVKDVTGAGDTVLAMICLGIANGLDLSVAVQLANVAAGISVERLGCVQVTLAEVARRLLETDSQSKIFDESHTFALRQVLKDRKYRLLVVEGQQASSRSLFQALRQLSQHGDDELVVYIRGQVPGEEVLQVLSSLHSVGFIILQTQSLKHLCEAIHPSAIFSLEDNALVPVSQPRELLHSLLLVEPTEEFGTPIQ